MSGPFAGVDREALEQAANEAPSSAPETQSAPESSGKDGFEIGNGKQDLGGATSTEGEPLTKQEILDLDKHEKFRWQGREWTREELQKSYMMQSDYTRKTAELSESRKYATNFDADLERVIENPELMAQMKAIYPASYVKLAERVLARMSPEQSEPASQQQQAQGQSQDYEKMMRTLLNKELAPLKEWKEQVSQQQYESEVKAIQAELDNKFDKLQAKYPEASQREVHTLIDAAIKRGETPNDSLFEKLFKESHSSFEKRYAERQTKQIAEQKKANAKARDIGQGGGTPGQAPIKRDMKSAREALLAEAER